ncbi:MAG: glycosyltransferase family 9 protein [Thermomicrobium sp.]|nr:glycosyltransferase family 9 protein [Thermomicrobium sp.]MCS7246294.1 glycosyltransferase family 9 protein [Thermomicrobium sp.]MDW7982251.1 glycosyltransferase family 9 protein [Thermomicrobium sp.]
MRTRFERILAIKIADLGDAVLTLPALQALRSSYPHARLHVLTSPNGAALYRLCPVIDRIEVLDKSRLRQGQGLLAVLALGVQLRRRQYDAVLLFHHLTTRSGRLLYRALLAATGSPVRVGLDNGTGTFLTHPVVDRGFGALAEWEYALALVQALGVAEPPARPFLTIPDEARQRARTLLEGLPRPFAVLHPGVGPFAPARRWPAERFAAVARTLQAFGLGITVTGTIAEARDAAPLLAVDGIRDLVGRTDVPTLAAVLAEAAVVIGSDCGVVHLAAALGRPTLALFGPTNVEAWRPLDARIAIAEPTGTPSASVLALTAQLPCSPCCYVGYRLGRPQGCKQRTCLELLTPEVVARKALALIGREPGHDCSCAERQP